MRGLPSDQDHTGRSFGAEELENLAQVMDTGMLFGPKGRFVKELEEGFASHLAMNHAVACSSGTAAVHVALAALDSEPGDEVITTAITDMGALGPILYQGAIPVFADVDPATGLVTADTIRDRLSDRTRAIVVTHLFGNPCEMAPIVELANDRGIAIIEDCAQAFTAGLGGRMVGTFGAIASFSLQQGKHITSGEGGLVATNDPELAHRSKLFVNKAWDYDQPSDHDFLALNYRMSELQGAVAVAQLAKLEFGSQMRRVNARRLDDAVADLAGIRPVATYANADHSYWRYCLDVDSDVVPGGPNALAGELRSLGFPSAPRYIQKPAFQCGIFRDQRTFGTSRWPFTMARPEAVDYSPDSFPGTFAFLDRVLVLPWNERYTSEEVDLLASALSDASKRLAEVAA